MIEEAKEMYIDSLKDNEDELQKTLLYSLLCGAAKRDLDLVEHLQLEAEILRETEKLGIKDEHLRIRGIYAAMVEMNSIKEE